MLNSETDVAISEPSASQIFVERASGRLAGIRNGILIFDQDHSSQGDLDVSILNLRLLSRDAGEFGFSEIVDLAEKCEAALQPFLAADRSNASSSTGYALDLVASIEERILTIPLDSDEFLDDVSGFVDLSFESLTSEISSTSRTNSDEDFELDEETLEIFASEARELLDGISHYLTRLNAESTDRDALWEIRRNAHTLKGAAGIVGLKTASELAHRIEDLLDKMVDTSSTVSPEMLDLFARSAEYLESIISGRQAAGSSVKLDNIYADFTRIISTVEKKDQKTTRSEPKGPLTSLVPQDNGHTVSAKPVSTPVVRVSLDRLDDLIKLSRSLSINRSAIAECFTEIAPRLDDRTDALILEKIASLFDVQQRLTDEIHEKLFGVRMVKFGVLETRLSRAIQVTAQDENKLITVLLENGDCEVDTQVIDAMIEPLIHLLKNAVVHGIEPGDTRRLIGKPERGTIRIRIDADEASVTVMVEDDGRGISLQKLKLKAQMAGVISQETAGTMSEQDAFALMFQRGITTADKLDLNAGRGVGMSIVKESIESHGGTVAVVSKPQIGTVFTITMPQLSRRNSLGESRPKTTLPVISTPPVTLTDQRVLSVMIVDDSSSIRLITSNLIETAGWKAIVARDGIDAIEILRRSDELPDMILTDLEMPRMDGYELVSTLNDDSLLRHIPIIMITSRTEEAYREMALELGVAEFLSKPYNEGVLIESIRKLCSK